MEHSAHSPAEWGAAMRECVSSRSFYVMREQVLLLYVAAGAVFHPLHELLPRQTKHQSQRQLPPFIAVMRLHEHVSTLLRDLQAKGRADACAPLVESLVFASRVVDAASAKRAADANGMLTASVPFFQPREVNLSGGALCSFAASEAEAKTALSDITVAMQAADVEDLDFLHGDDDVIVMVEHDEGYIGQQFDHRIVSKIIRVRKRPFAPNARSFDAVLESYEEEYREMMEINGLSEQPSSLSIEIQAGFAIRASTSSISEMRSTETSRVYLLSSWRGIENVRSLLCTPPPNSSSMVCFDGTSVSIGSRSPRVSIDSNEPFSAQVRHAINFLSHVENLHSQQLVWYLLLLQSANDPAYKWPDNPSLANGDSDKSDRDYLVRKFRRFLADPDVALDDTIDTNTTMELNLPMNFDRDGERMQNRTDLDFLEKMWEFLLAHADSRDTVVTLVQEFIVAFATARVIPHVHPENATQLAAFLVRRIEECRSAEKSSALHQLQIELSQPNKALQSVLELGVWKLERDIASWFTQIGFTATESQLIINQLQQRQTRSGGTSLDAHIAVQYLVYVCALAVPLGISGPLLRRLVNDCLGCLTHQTNSAGDGVPCLVAPLNSFIPERLRSNLADPVFWDLETSFSELMEMKVQVPSVTSDNFLSQQSRVPFILDSKTLCQLHQCLVEEIRLLPAVREFMQNAEKHSADNSSSAAGLVQYECTSRKIMYRAN
ncbi:hypothetical protein FI667_g2522, partial [Globisporangium splendens]